MARRIELPEPDQGGVALMEDPKTGQPLFQEPADDESPRQVKARQEADWKRYVPWAELATAQKTQMISDRRFTDGRPFAVSIPDDKAQPEVIVKAKSQAEAGARYQRLCGIRSTDHEVVARKVTAEQEAEIRKSQERKAEDQPADLDDWDADKEADE